VLDTLKPDLVPAGRIVSAVVHGGHPSDIESVMVDGEFIMRHHKVLTLDEPAILKEADAVGKRIWNKVGPVTVPRLPRPR
jgi:5-methylthioadenosine/S-adenosylhomocysteine deaminase